MQIQLYLSSEAQQHFGIAPQEILSDSEVPLTSDWRALWRCDHLATADDTEEHLFMVTNVVSNYSIIVVDRAATLDQLLSNFQQTLLVTFCDHGMPYPEEDFCTEIQLLSSNDIQRTATQSYTAELALESLCSNGVDIDAAEKVINIHASKALRSKLAPKKEATAVASAILSFPGCAVGL